MPHARHGQGGGGGFVFFGQGRVQTKFLAAAEQVAVGPPQVLPPVLGPNNTTALRAHSGGALPGHECACPPSPGLDRTGFHGHGPEQAGADELFAGAWSSTRRLSKGALGFPGQKLADMFGRDPLQAVETGLFEASALGPVFRRKRTWTV